MFFCNLKAVRKKIKKITFCVINKIPTFLFVVNSLKEFSIFVKGVFESTIKKLTSPLLPTFPTPASKNPVTVSCIR